MTTDHASERETAAAYVLGLLPEEERREFEAHLGSCLECVREVRELGEVATALAESAEAEAPSSRVRAALLAQVGGPRAAPRRSSSGWWLAAAASVALVLAGTYAAAMRARAVSLEGDLDSARGRLASAESAVDELRRTAASAGRVTVILASADVTQVDLAGQAAAPGAGGRAFWSRSRGLIVTATNLPPAAAGKVYELWIVTARDKINAGLFSPDDSGTAALVIDSPTGVEPVAIAVTLEPAGGVPQPTGPMYLVGSL